MTKRYQLSDGSVWEDEDDLPDDAAKRAIAEFENRIAADKDLADDTGGETADKSIRTLVRGTGQGIAETLDLPGVGAQWLSEVLKNVKEESLGRPYERKAAEWPISSAFEKHVAAPVIPGYERMNDVTAMIAPAVVESALTLGTGAPAAIATMAARTGLRGVGETARQLAGAGVRTGAHAGTTTATGVAGSEIGGALGEAAGGDVGRELGGALGGSVTGGVSPTRKVATRSQFTDVDSRATVDAVNRVNDFLRLRGINQDLHVPHSLGLIGSKNIGVVEDLLARGAWSGRPVIESRRAQYSGIDRALQEAIAEQRGGPAGGPITKEGIGVDIEAMLADTSRTIDQQAQAIQEALARDIGPGTRTNPVQVETRLQGIISDNTQSNRIRQQAARLLDTFRANYEPPASGVGPSRPPTYGAVKDVRSEAGAQLPEEGLSRKVEGPFYTGLTETMQDTAQRQGVTDFGPRQDQYSRLRRQRDEQVTPLQEARTEGGTFQKLLGGAGKNSLRQLEPFFEHAPGGIGPILADALELRLRGANAGRAVDPELVDIKAPQREWASQSPEWQAANARPEVQNVLNDIRTISQADVARSGKRSAPTSSSTIGETSFLSPTALSGGIGGVLGGPLGAAVGLVGLPALRRMTARVMTNPGIVRRLFEPDTIRQIGTRAGAGAAVGGAFQREREKL